LLWAAPGIAQELISTKAASKRLSKRSNISILSPQFELSMAEAVVFSKIRISRSS
jgi:hypothetical protein